MRFLLVPLGLTVRFSNSPRGVPGPRGRCRTFMDFKDMVIVNGKEKKVVIVWWVPPLNPLKEGYQEK